MRADQADPLRYRVRFLILTLLALKPSHGYELSKRIERITGGLVRGSPGSIYPVLRELREEGLVEEDSVVERGRLRKVYRLTLKGAQELLEELNIFYDISNQLIQLATEARRSLQEMLRNAGTPPCPRPETVRGLRRLLETVQEYLRVLENRLRECGWQEGEAESGAREEGEDGEEPSG